MSKRSNRSASRNLMAVLVVSGLLHIAVFLILGSIVIFTAIPQSKPDFEEAIIAQPINLQELNVKQEMSKMVRTGGSSGGGAQQRELISVQQTLSTSALPALTMSVAPVSGTFAGPGAGVMSGAGVRVGSGYGSGTGDGLGGLGGSSGIGIGERSVSFLGVQSSGERVAILVDCSDYMLEDGKGGMWAFRVVKDECVKLVSAMQPGVLFNVYLFSHNNVNRFRPHMVATTPTVIQDLSEWVAPINEDAAKRGAQDNNFTPEREFFHQRATMYWNGRKRDKPQGVHTWANYGRALHAAMEDQAEAIFMIIATNPPMTEVFEDMNERTKKELLIIQARQDKRYETDIKIWEREYERWKELQEKAYRDYQAELAKARRELHDPVYAKAKEILDAENARRKAAGRPPRIIVGDAIKTIMEENNLKLPPLNVRRPAAVKNPPNRPQPGHVLVRPYTLMRMIEKFKQEIVPELYRLHPKKVIPSVNIILFGEGEAAEKYWTDFVEGVNQRNRGQFRKITSLEEMEASARLSIEQRGKYQGR